MLFGEQHHGYMSLAFMVTAVLGTDGECGQVATGRMLSIPTGLAINFLAA